MSIREAWAAALLASAVLTGCQTSQSGGKPAYSIFFDQGSHLEQLIAEEKWDEAGKLYGDENLWFEPRKAKYHELLQKAADALNAQFAPKLSNVDAGLDRASPDPRATTWKAAKSALDGARDELQRYDGYALLKQSIYRNAAADVLGRKATRRQAEWEDLAPTAFADYDHFSGVSFFEIYPVELDERALFQARLHELEGRLAAASPAQLLNFAKAYPKGEVLSEEQFAALNERYVDAFLRAEAGGGKPGLRHLVALATALQAGGPFKAVAAKAAHFAFVDATSQTLLDRGAIEFPPQIELDLPFEARTAELDHALSDPAALTADYLIVFDVALAKTERKVRDRKEMGSKFEAGRRSIPNPNYETAKMEWISAQSAYNQTVMSNNINRMNSPQPTTLGAAIIGGILTGVIQGIAEASAKEDVDKAFAVVQSTPQMIEEPIHQAYSYDRVTVDAKKLLTVNFYVIDRLGKRFYKDTFDVVEQEKFDVAYRVHKEDPSRSSILNSAASEDDVDKWEKKPVPVKLSALIEQYLRNSGSARPLPSLEAMRKEMLADKNLALAKFETTKFEQRADARFDSVVAVYNPQGALGSGFFVRPDVVLTNYHVISGAKFVEMRTYDKQETFGKVIDSDPRLDLALVKVQSRGKPVEFYEGKSLDLGATVEAIGHPRGAMFSITRGVVSAVRESATTYQMGGKPVLFVQTDAPISPGNSGGPLFLGGKVVGVNTQSRTDSQNLNLSVHYGEVLNFIRRSDAMN